MRYLSKIISSRFKRWLFLTYTACIVLLVLGLIIYIKINNNKPPIDTRIFYLNNKDQLCYYKSEEDHGGLEYSVVSRAHFQFSPNGKYICYLSPMDQLHIVDLESYQVKNLTEGKTLPNEWHSKGSIDNFEWSPDSTQILYSVYDEDSNDDGKIGWGDNLSLRIVDIAHQQDRIIVRSAACTFDPIYWSVDGQQIFYPQANAIGLRDKYIQVDLASKEQTSINFDPSVNQLSSEQVEGEKYHFHYNRNNNPSWDQTMPFDNNHSIGKKVFMESGNIFLDDEELAHFKWYDPKFNSGYYNPRWFNDRLIIYSGPSRNLPLPLNILFMNTSIYLADIQDHKSYRLLNGHSPGWWCN